MASSGRLKRPVLDIWSTKEKLALAGSVVKSGDQNWVSVSRSVRILCEDGRPPDWFSQKNCALQYAELLEKAETPKRKRGEKGEIIPVETPAMLIVRKLSIERIEELKSIVQQEEQQYINLKKDIQLIKSGKLDDQLPAMYEEIRLKQTTDKIAQEENKDKSGPSNLEQLEIPAVQPAEDKRDQRPKLTITIPPNILPSKKSPQGDPNLEALLQQPPQPLLNSKTESVAKEIPAPQPLVTMTKASTTMTPSVPIPVSTNTSTAALNTSATPETHVIPPALSHVKMMGDKSKTPTSPASIGAPTLTRILSTPSQNIVKPPMPTSMVSTNTPMLSTNTSVSVDHIKAMNVSNPVKTEEVKSTPTRKETPEKASEESESPQYINVEDDITIKTDEPISPTSSIVSNSSRSSKKRSRGRGSIRGSRRKSYRAKQKEEEVKLSDAESTDVETDDTATPSRLLNTPSFMDSIPNSPVSQCSDTEDEKAHKAWKKSIMLVWRQAATHKDANVFVHPVTNDIAPGYNSIVYRPMDLTTIKKNIESGSLRTTSEFQRDMMLMFTNAIMYNNSDQNVYQMAEEMYNDIMPIMEQYINTQVMVQSTDPKSLRGSRRSDTMLSDKDDESQRRRTSTEQESGGKVKKRKTRADD